MVNVSELLELRFGNPTKQISSDNQGTAGGDLVDEVRVSTELKDEVKGDEKQVEVEQVSNSNPIVVEGEFVALNGEVRVTEEVVGGLEQTGNELNEINLAVDLSLRRVSEEVGGFKQNGIQLNGINLVVDLSPRVGLDGKFSNGNGSKVCSGGIDLPVSDGLRDDSKQNVVIGEEHMGKECRTEIEGNYEVTDLVWGKVRSHPWWPGQIIDPTAASEKAKKHSKKDGFLIAYFGDQTYAWNDVSQIKPFRKHFSRMVKQSNTEAFCHALGCALHEVSRRVEFGLACSCLSEDMLSEIKSQVLVNAGVSEEFRRRDGGDRFSSVASFVPARLVEIVKALAVDPFGKIDRLEFVKAKAQLSAYYRWKGYYQLPVRNLLNGLVENADSEPDSGKENMIGEAVAACDSYSRKGKRIPTEGVSSSKKVKRLSELTSEDCLKLNVQNNNSVKSGSKRKVVDSLSDDSRDESGTVGKKSLAPPAKKAYKVAESIRRIARKLSGSTSSFKNGVRSSQNSVSRNTGTPTHVEIPAAYPPSEEILSQLILVAIDPMKENSSLTSLVRFFSDFRSYSVEISNKKEVSVLDSIEDSYWTDRIIQSNPEEQVLFEPEVASLESNGEKPAGHLNDKSKEYFGTALILNFDKKVSVPSVTNLTDIYTKYGPLKEVSTKNKSARVVFEMRSDAETAFSRAGKYSLFGPSLLNYSLDYYPTPRRITTRAKKKTEGKDASLGNMQELED